MKENGSNKLFQLFRVAGYFSLSLAPSKKIQLTFVVAEVNENYDRNGFFLFVFIHSVVSHAIYPTECNQNFIHPTKYPMYNRRRDSAFHAEQLDRTVHY